MKIFLTGQKQIGKSTGIKETIYLQTLLDSIDKFPNILGVLKKYDIQYIHEIAARKDVIVFDLDVMAYEDVKKYILKAMGG